MNNKIFFFSFMAIWVLLIILNFIIPNKEFSEQENRPLAKLPYFTFEKLVDGKYVSQMDDYINDHFIFRNEFILEKMGIYLKKRYYLKLIMIILIML